jgi:DnaA family protein
MAEQLVFELGRVEPPTFANFVAGSNAEALATLRRFASGDSEGSVVLWGAPGAGKTHLLRGCVAEALAAGRNATYCDTPASIPTDTVPHGALLAIDALDSADSEEQARLFTLFNALPSSGGRLVCAAARPPARLALREDLRTRIGQALVFEVTPLADKDLPLALGVYARERGVPLAPDVVDYLLRRQARDLRSLTQIVAALDRHSLAVHRPITVPLLREWLGRDV